ncbi:protein ECT2 isoform X1 [Euwallacea similis]|uniref:protein ECT2 isoform X1 n=1 Tax=Euwallacea similis TaxID=1736056 RepID=UPI00344B8257
MDEFNAQIQTQGSICSDSNGEETRKTNEPLQADRRICLIGNLAKDSKLREVANSFGVPVVTSEDGQEYFDTAYTYFVMADFESDLFFTFKKANKNVLGPIALQQFALKSPRELPSSNTRPLFNMAMKGVVVCFTGFRSPDELTKLVPYIHHMGGSVRKDTSASLTHLIAKSCGGEKYLYAATFKVPVMNLLWVIDSWELHRWDIDFSAAQESFVNEYKLKPFHGARVCFAGFPEDEERHMTEVLVANGGTVTTLDDPACTHVVMENPEVYTLEAANAPLSPKPVFPESLKTPKNNSIADFACVQATSNTVSLMETVPEVARPNDDLVSEMDSVCFEEQSFEIGNISMKRKRKFVSPDNTLIKRKRDKCCSERKKRVSSFFKTPINYFSNRRRTIDAPTFNHSLNDSAMSTSGVFNTDTLDNLSICVESESTPRASLRKSKKNLFTRTFSSSRFARSKSKLNSSKLSFNDDLDKTDINASCLSNISLRPKSSQPQDQNDCGSKLAPASRRTSALAVVDEASVADRPEVPARHAYIVKAEWFWTSVQKECSLRENDYLFDDYVETQVTTPGMRRDSHATTPCSGSRKRRKPNRHETIQSLVQHTQSPALHKRRSSASEAGRLSVSGSFLDCTASPAEAGILDVQESQKDSPRRRVFRELFETETNYVQILEIIITLFKTHLETMQDREALLNNTELNLIFGKLPPIYDTHVKMLDEFLWLNAHWNEERSIGNIIIKYSNELQKAYPPFINYFEEMKEVLTNCDQSKPRFHAFLKAMQTKPECGRQSLQELMIRPVQRLGSICLLLNDILKNTQKNNPDHSALELALAALREVMTHINEDKRKAEGQVTLFNIFNDIDNCPPDIVSSHRSYVTKAEVVQLSSSEGLASKGSSLVLFLFSDKLEICKKKSSKAFVKSPSAGSYQMTQGRTNIKPYKHVKIMALNNIKRVIDIKETEDCQKVFSLVCRNNEENKEKLYSFAMDEDADKMGFLKTLTRTMANNVCAADADKFMAYLEPQQLDIDTSDLSNGTLSRAFARLTRTRLKVGRTFSFNKSTPSKLKRAVSSMMSPFGSSTNLTPASQLANMRLASYSNINELGNNTENAEKSPPIAPLSVQPTRKLKTSSLGVNVKRL